MSGLSCSSALHFHESQTSQSTKAAVRGRVLKVLAFKVEIGRAWSEASACIHNVTHITDTRRNPMCMHERSGRGAIRHYEMANERWKGLKNLNNNHIKETILFLSCTNISQV
jgi:hypothetical protein